MKKTAEITPAGEAAESETMVLNGEEKVSLEGEEKE